MLYFNRNRYLAGNICFVLFLTFLFSLAFTVVPQAAQADEPPPVEKSDREPGAPSGGGVTRVTPAPTTKAEFATVIEKLLQHLAGVDDLVNKVVYSEVYNRVYEVVYGTVYEVYQYIIWLVYGPPGSGYTVGTQAYEISYMGLKDDRWQSVTVEVPVPVPKQVTEPGPGPAPAPAPPTTKTDFGTVAWDKEAGKGEAKVDATLAANLIQEARQKGQATVDLRVSVPADVTLKSFTAEVPARVLVEALTASVAPLVGTANLYVAVDPARIPADVKAELAAKPDAKLEFKFNVLPEAEAKQATAVLPATYKVAGSVVTLELAFAGRALPGSVTLTYGTGAAAKSGLFAALDLFGLFRGDGKLAAAGLDEDKLGVYRYNEASKAWEYVGGRVDKVKKTVTAKLAALGLAKYAVMAYEKTFADLALHWAKRDVEIMAARHVAGGVTEELFNPNGQVTRAEFAALLIRTLGIAETKPAAPHFKDVAASDWYYGAIETARAAGLVGGYPDGTFKPKANISREEIASMVHRALLYAGKKPQVAGGVEAILARFADAGQIGGWARESVAAAVGENILRGRTASTVVPKGNATRAEATVMLKRALVSLGELSE